MFIIHVIINRFRQCHQQNGSIDCGLFALAFASILASGNHPSSYYLQQKFLRKHLHTCIENGCFKAFPTARVGRVKNLIRYEYSIGIYCYCRMPETFSKKMVKCDKCFKWFHLEVCVDRRWKKWYCRNCH